MAQKSKAGAGKNPIKLGYDALDKESKSNLKGAGTSEKLLSLVKTSLDFLSDQADRVDLISKVSGKGYFAYALKTAPTNVSRPANRALFMDDATEVIKQWKELETRPLLEGQIARLCYTMANAYSMASDLFDRNNKKGPATYFERLIGHLAARRFGINPTKQAHFIVDGKSVSMTMDLIFDLGEAEPKIHLPVKLSTRERGGQAWAHQRMLDAAYGDEAYKALLVVHSETKLDSKKLEVVEICVPDQWLAYQTLVARMDRIYYFDIPERYATLARDFPDRVSLRPFADFIREVVSPAPSLGREDSTDRSSQATYPGLDS